MKIIFAGTPEFALPALNELLNSHHRVEMVITTPDKRAGRGLAIKPSPVKEFALAHKLNLEQPENLIESGFLERVKKIGADIGIVIAFKKLPRELYSIPKFGFFNVHASLLPQYRGAAPINWAIINGETETGVTSFFINDEIDKGNIILSEKCKIEYEDTYGSLYEKLSKMSAKLVIETLKLIETGEFETISQNEMMKKYNINEIKNAPKICKNDCRVDWSRTSKQVYDFVRGLNPTPSAYSIMVDNLGNEIFVKIHHVAEVKNIDIKLDIGEIKIECSKMFVGVGNDGVIEIIELQPESRNKLSVKSFIAGLQNRKVCRFI